MLSEWLGIRGLEAALPLAILSGAIGLCWTLPSAIIPVEALTHLGDAQKVSVLFFAISVVGVSGAIAVPLLVYRLGRRLVVILGFALTILSGVFLAIEAPLALIAGAALRVFGFLCIDVVLEIIIMERIPRRNIARFEAVRMFSMGVGLIAGPWLGTALASRVEYWTPFALMVFVLVAVCVYLFHSTLANSLTAQTEGGKPPNPLQFIRRFVKQPRLRLAWLLSFARSAWWTMFFIYSPIYCVEAGLGEESGGIVLSVGSAAILLAPVFGKIGARIGVRLLLSIGYASTGIATVLVAVFAESIWVGLGFLITAATCAAIIDAVGNALFLRAVRARERAEMTAVFTTYREVAQLAPPGLFSVLLTTFTLPAVFIVSGASMLAMLAFTRFIPRGFR